MALYFVITFWVSLAAAALYFWMKHRFGYWKRRGVFSPPATFLLGHMGPVAKNEASFGMHMRDIYVQTKKNPYVGLFMFTKQALLVNDLDFIKNVLLKEYNYFQGHGFKTDKQVDPLGQHLFNLEGDDWKRIRVKLTPTFTSSKIKYMFDTVATCTDVMTSYIKETVGKGSVLEIKDVLARCSTDVIGSCAFGIETNSFKHPDAEFRKMGKKVFLPGKIKSLIEVLTFVAPSLVCLLRLSFNFADVTKFFTKLVPDTIKAREDMKIKRNDFLQLLIDLKNKEAMTGDGMTIEEITAQVYVFFLAGFETSSTTASYALLELAKHQDIQDALRAEIETAVEHHGGKVTYDAVQEMSNLSMIIEETLRTYPPVPFLFRFCTKDYTIPGTSSVVEKGTLVIIPVLGIHNDPDIYPEPEKFIPERFSPENIADRHQFAHIPFGEGPRICIGARFGLLQTKLIILKIIRNFKLTLCDETKFPLKFEAKSIIYQTVGGIHLRLTPR